MTPAWFILALLLLNLGAASAFALERNLPWAMIYVGAAIIQAGCLVGR